MSVILLVILYFVLLFGIPALTGCSLSTFCGGAVLGIAYMLCANVIRENK